MSAARSNPDLFDAALTVIIGGVALAVISRVNLTGLGLPNFGLPIGGGGSVVNSNNPGLISGATGSTGADEFNINAQESTAVLTVHESRAQVHLALGHAGSGGQFLARAETAWSVLGIFSGPGYSLGDHSFSVGADNDWTGYGIDWDVTGVPMSPGQVVKLSIFDASGHKYASLTLNPVTQL